ncbi:hypothetical protein B566_EDAN017900 [Ephemera danica]|nr:hypothetical protein B566_EDAN017900 [Ephemera danica]
MPSGCYHCVLIPEASEPCVICKKLGHTRPFECADNLFQMYGLSIEPGEGSVAENENPDASQLVCCTCEDCTEPTIEPFVASMLPVEEN